MKNLIEFLKSQRTSQNEIKVTFMHLETNDVFSVFWSNIHAGTGEITTYDLLLDCESDNEELALKIEKAINDSDESQLYLEILEKFNSLDCENEEHDLEILNTCFNVEDEQKNDDGEYNLVSWLEIEVIYDGDEITLSMQFDCGSGFDLFMLGGVGDIENHLIEAINESDCFSILIEEEREYINKLKLEDFECSNHYENVKQLAEEVNKIVGDNKDYLLLSKTLFESESIDIGHCMCFLQINLGVTQEQSRKIVELFI